MADTTTLATVEFHGAHLVTTIINGVPHVAMRPLCEAIGLDWNGQYQRLTRHPVLGPVMCMTHTTGGDGKRYEMACLPLNMLNGWLFGVDTSRVKPEAQERLLDYQRECFDVLADYWQKGSANNPRSAQPALVGKATGLPLAQLQGLQDQSWKLITRLKGETQRELRASLYEQLLDVYQDMGKQAPPLVAMGADEPENPIAAVEFWAAYQALKAAGVVVNHHRDPRLIAVNLRQFSNAAAERKIRIGSHVALKDALRRSKSPRFHDVRTINSAVLGCSVHCWIFEAVVAEEGGAV